MEPSHPPTPELLPEPVAESPTLEGFSPAALPPVPHTSSFAMFPLVVTRAKTHEHTIAFQADRQKSEKANSKLDPHAADFIRDKLGEHRWTIFSSRLAERRTTTQKPKKNDGASMTLNGRPPDAFSGDKAAGASAVDFLVKVEVVKSVLRTYVPHPYNPLKTLSHNFPPAPSGQVTLSRSTILSLSGWSNTQFSYWARRSEAISVLAVHDERLRTVATALERRLRTSGLSDSPSEPSSPSSSHSIQPSYEYGGISREMGVDAEDWVRMYVTGKGLDVIIDEVKKRTGVSPFLRGKHSSLDPFGTANVEGEPESGKKAVVYMPTFQAEKYVHEVPTEVDPSALSSMIAGKRAGKRKAVSPPPEGSESEDSWPSMASEVSADDFVVPHFAPLPSRTPSLSPPFLYPGESPVSPIPPSAGIDLSILESRSHYLDPIDLSQTMPPGPPPPSGRAKKRRIAPAPQPFDPQAQFADNPRLYANHLETG
ncbi:hypothetical protein EW026_g3126 [Hermanssonia centrifuga]|uniref:Uncharacterized protein n=1 Tax=Hermanssonia centrifuga TaxID=98765 RepID=A0A4S4KQR4_9APHY|nr:hypothetical protein EW026_g3126 [Hermanssonia centrifuga]